MIRYQWCACSTSFTTSEARWNRFPPLGIGIRSLALRGPHPVGGMPLGLLCLCLVIVDSIGTHGNDQAKQGVTMNALSRRRFLRGSLIAATGILAAACQPKVVEKVVERTVEVEKIVEKEV